MNTNTEALVISGTAQRHHSLKLTASIFEPGFDWLDRRCSLYGFTREVQQYQKRYFTYKCDTLNAFKGILSVIDMRSYWGVPILRPFSMPRELREAKHPIQRCIITLGFAFGLLWHVTKRTQQLEPQNNENRYKYLPSWSWVSQTGVLVEFIWFQAADTLARLTRVRFGFVPSKTKFAADVWAVNSEGTRTSIDGLFQNHNDWNCAPEQTTFLVVTSITAKWKLKNRQSHGDFVPSRIKNSCQVALSDISSELIQSMSNGIARVSLDQESCQLPSLDEQNHASLPAQEGFAILILISTYFADGPEAYWLAVRPLQDGAFRREGILESSLLGTFDQEYKLQAESLKTIRLG